jgi:hypothetical protein
MHDLVEIILKGEECPRQDVKFGRTGEERHRHFSAIFSGKKCFER